MPDRYIVVNSTPIIALLNIKQLDILQKLYANIYIPTAVKDEVAVKTPGFIQG